MQIELNEMEVTVLLSALGRMTVAGGEGAALQVNLRAKLTGKSVEDIVKELVASIKEVKTTEPPKA